MPTDKISASFSKICSPRSRKTQACNAPRSPQGKIIDREQAVPRLSVSADRPKHNIIGPKLCNRLPPSSLAQKTSIRRGKNARKKALQASDYTISIMLRSCVRARWKESASTLSVEAATFSSVAQGRRTPPARRSLRTFLASSLRALLSVQKGAARLNVNE